MRLLILLGDQSEARGFQNQLNQIAAPTTADQINEARLMRLEGNPIEAKDLTDKILSGDPENWEGLELSRSFRVVDTSVVNHKRVRSLECSALQSWSRARSVRAAERKKAAGDQ